MKTLKFDVFGREIWVVAAGGGWQAFHAGSEGKRRPATDIVLPRDLEESELARYLADLCHEWATDRSPDVRRLD